MLTTDSVRCKFNLEAMQSIRALIKSAFFRARFSIYGQTAVKEEKIKVTSCLVVTNKCTYKAAISTQETAVSLFSARVLCG